MEYWLDGFRRDSHPSQEVSYWEHVAAVYREYVAKFPELKPSQRMKIYHVIQSLWLDIDKDQLEKLTSELTNGYVESLLRLYGSKLPIFDKVEASPFSNADAEQNMEAVLERIGRQDKEYFPDLPEDLVRKLMGTT